MEDFNTFFCPSKFPFALERISPQFIDTSGRDPKKFRQPWISVRTEWPEPRACLFTSSTRPALGYTKTPIRWERNQNSRNVRLPALLHRLSGLRMPVIGFVIRGGGGGTDGERIGGLLSIWGLHPPPG